MTQARRKLVPPKQAGSYHCVSRCVRRAWLCGEDHVTGRNFEHRKPLVERRILALGKIFAVGIYAYAVMSNHLHVVLTVQPDQANQWSREEVAQRWLELFPATKAERAQERRAELLANPERLELCRERLADLSWFMRCLNEYLARLFNREDDCTGRFWEGRFSCQALLNHKALLAAMAYVDLNPIRAKAASNIPMSRHTAVRKRFKAVEKNLSLADLKLKPIVGCVSPSFPEISERQYLELIDWTGRQWHPGKRGVISASEPSALQRLGLDPDHWTRKVRGIGSMYWRVIGTVDEMLDKAKHLKQRWLRGIRFARSLVNNFG